MEPFVGLIAIDVWPCTNGDRARLERALEKLETADRSFRAQFTSGAKFITLVAMGEPPIDIIIDRLAREFHVEATVPERLAAASRL